MGNQLTGAAPSQIIPVETYVDDIRAQMPSTDIKFVRSLGNTRFFKVARLNHPEGHIVAKVFAIHDPTLSLIAYRNRISQLREKLIGVYNALPYEKIMTAESKAEIILRPFMNMCLFERIHMRPFLTLIEKKWIAFQLLCALSQCHGVEVYHGDIKSENVLLTSWGWLMLSDFAVFKPAYLPADNPTDFAYFYDTSSRGTCYIAPERFVTTNRSDVAHAQTGGQDNLFYVSRDELESIDTSSRELRGLEQPSTLTGEVNAAMDLFSVGCVMLELFTDGQIPFDLAQLLAYRNGEYSPDSQIGMVADPMIREIIEQLLKRDPIRRQSAEEYLIRYRGRCFPNYFYSYLKSAMHIGSVVEPDLLHTDDRMCKLYREWPTMKRCLVIDRSGQQPGMNEGLLIMVNAITAIGRNLNFSQVKLMALELLVRCARYIHFEWVLDRIVPFILDFVGDKCDQIRRAVPLCLTAALSRQPGPLAGVDSEANIFPEFIFPALQPLVRDRQVGVRCAYASVIADLCYMALEFLRSIDMRRGQGGQSSIEQAGTTYDEEVANLRQLAEGVLVPFLTDAHNSVRMAVVGELGRLCCFLGVVKSTDVLLSHMITFLNDKEDCRLRATFFDNVLPVVSYVGRHAADMIKSVLEMGLTDPNPGVLVSALRCLTQLVSVKLLALEHYQEYLALVIPLLGHPATDVRRACVSFVASAARILPPWDEYRILRDPEAERTSLAPYLMEPVENLSSEECLFDSLLPPVPQELFDTLAQASMGTLDFYLRHLEERRDARSQTRRGQAPNYPMLEEPMARLHVKLAALGMTSEDEDRLCRLRDLIYRVRASYTLSAAQPDLIVSLRSTLPAGRSGTTRPSPGPAIAVLQLVEESSRKTTPAPTGQRALSPERPLPLASVGTREINREWQLLFMGSETNRGGGSSMPAQNPSTPSVNNTMEMTRSVPETALATIVASRKENSAVPPKEKKIFRYSSSFVYEFNLRLHKREQYLNLTAADDSTGQWEQVSTRPAWRPQGVLLGDLHEHCGAIDRLAVRPQGDLFYTVGNDGMVKAWNWGPNIRREEATVSGRAGGSGSSNVGSGAAGDSERALTYRSQFSYKADLPLRGLVFLNNGAQLVTAVGDKRLVAISTHTGTVVWSSDLTVSSHGHVTALSGRSSDSLFFYTTTTGAVVAMDSRNTTRPAFTMPVGSMSPTQDEWNGRYVGLLISLCVYSPYKWLATGSSLGVMSCCDLRFRRPVCTTQHPEHSAILRLETQPGERSTVVAAVQGNNELSWWDLDTQIRRKTLWASSNPPLSKTSTMRYCSAFHVISNVTSGGEQSTAVITGSTDMRIRYWDFQHTENCRLVSRRYTDTSDVSERVGYMTRMVEGTQVIQEVYQDRRKKVETHPFRCQDPAVGHKDVVNDLLVANVGQPILVTAARDGVIKLWK